MCIIAHSRNWVVCNLVRHKFLKENFDLSRIFHDKKHIDFESIRGGTL